MNKSSVMPLNFFFEITYFFLQWKIHYLIFDTKILKIKVCQSKDNRWLISKKLLGEFQSTIPQITF